MLASESITLITLGENAASERGILGEWGWSVLVRFSGRSLLLDAGPGASTAHNAGSLGADLKAVEAVVLSHGHYDHTGGLPQLLEAVGRDNVPVYAHPGIWGMKYSRNKKTGAYRYVRSPGAVRSWSDWAPRSC